MKERTKEVSLAVLASGFIIILSGLLVLAMKPETGFAMKEPRIFITILVTVVAFFSFLNFFNLPKSKFVSRFYAYMIPFIGIFFYVLGKTIRDNYTNRYSRFGLFFFVLTIFILILVELSFVTRNYLFSKIKMKHNIKRISSAVIFSGITFGLLYLLFTLTVGGGWKISHSVPDISKQNIQTTTSTPTSTSISTTQST